MSRVRKRILFVNYCMAMGGIENMIVDFVRHVPRDEFEPQVAVFESGGSLEQVLEAEGVPVHRLHKREGIDLGLVLRLRQLIRGQGIDVIHSHNYSAWLYACLAARATGNVIHVHTEHSEVDRSWRRYLAERWLSRFTTFVVAVSRHVHAAMIQDIGIDPRRVRLVYNGVDVSRFSPGAGRRAGARQGLGLSPDQVAIGIVARLARIKNHDALLRAFAPLCQEPGNRARLVVVGDGPERAALEQLAHGLGITNGVTFLGERHDIPELLNAFDIYALTSLNEGMNLTLLEAMSTGLPVVATAVGGNVEIVEEGVTGCLVPSGDIGALTERLRYLVNSAAVRTPMGQEARARVLRLFDQQAMMRDYLALYRGVGKGTT